MYNVGKVTSSSEGEGKGGDCTAVTTQITNAVQSLCTAQTELLVIFP